MGKWILLLSFCLPMALLLFLFVVIGIAPFGEKSLVIIDATGQYISFSSFLKNALQNGESLLYSWKQILGGPVAGLFGYYLASPFELIFLLFPQNQMLTAFDLMLALKLASCGFTMAVFFRERSRLTWSTLLFTTAYAFCGFNMAFGWCVMWLDAVILLPLIALGLCRIAEGKGYVLYLCSLGVAIICNYYIGYMLCIFSVLFYLYLRMADAKRLKPEQRDAVFCAASLGAGALSAVMLLPVLGAMKGAAGFSVLDGIRRYTYPAITRFYRLILPGLGIDTVNRLILPTLVAVLLIFAALIVVYWKICRRGSAPGVKQLLCLLLLVALIELWHVFIDRYVLYAEYMTNGDRTWSLHKLFLGYTGYDEISAGGPNLYVGPLMPVLVGLYLLNRHIPWRERGAALFLLFVFYFSITLVLPNTFWHLCTETHLFSFRYSFCCSFVLLILGERSWQRIEENHLKILLPVAFAGIALEIATMVLIPREISDRQAILDVILFVFTSAMLCLGVVKKRKAFLLACGLLQMIAVTTVLWANYSDHADHHSLLQTEYDTALSEGNRAIAAVRQLDTGTYRTRNDREWLSKNDPMLFDYIGSSYFSSSEKRSNTDFMSSIGVHTFPSRWSSGNDGQSRAADALLGVKYLFAPTADYPEVAEGIYENPYDLSLSMIVPDQVTVLENEERAAAENLNAIFAAMGADHAVFSEIETDCTSAQRNSLCQKFLAENSDPVYLQLRQSLPEEVVVFVNGDQIKAFSEQCGSVFYPNQLFMLGSFSAGDVVEIRIYGYEPDHSSELTVYSESSGVLSSMREKIASQPSALQMLRDDHVLIHAEAGEDDQCLLISVPYDRAWGITVDGVKTEAVAAFSELLAIPLQPGAHVVEMKYWPAGLTPGIFVSGITACLVATDVLRRKRRTVSVGERI